MQNIHTSHRSRMLKAGAMFARVNQNDHKRPKLAGTDSSILETFSLAFTANGKPQACSLL